MKKEMMKRLKGLMALVLCFGMMFGSSLTVFAATQYTYNSRTTLMELKGTVLNKDDSLMQTSGDVVVVQYWVNDTKLSVDSQNKTVWNAALSIQEYNGCTRWKVADIWEASTEMQGVGFIMKLVPWTEPSDTNGGAGHKHSFEWDMTKVPTRTEDGEASYICKICGLVAETQPATRWQWFMKEYRGLIKDAEQNATVTFEADDMPCISDYMLSLNAARPDVTMIVHFTYEGVSYELTIPAGTDFSAIENDTDTFYGYLGLAAKLGLTATVLS